MEKVNFFRSQIEPKKKKLERMNWKDINNGTPDNNMDDQNITKILQSTMKIFRDTKFKAALRV